LTNYFPGLRFADIDRMVLDEICRHLAVIEKLESLKAEAAKNNKAK